MGKSDISKICLRGSTTFLISQPLQETNAKRVLVPRLWIRYLQLLGAVEDSESGHENMLSGHFRP